MRPREEASPSFIALSVGLMLTSSSALARESAAAAERFERLNALPKGDALDPSVCRELLKLASAYLCKALAFTRRFDSSPDSRRARKAAADSDKVCVPLVTLM